MSIITSCTIKPGCNERHKEQKCQRKSFYVSYVIVITGVTQTYQRQETKHEHQTLSLLPSSALCPIFTAT